MKELNQLELLTSEILSCFKCGEYTEKTNRKGEVKREYLVKGLRKDAVRLTDSSLDPVPGSGPSNAKIVLVGEAPGADEDVEGVPFVGRSGKYLRERLLRLAKIKPSEVRFVNVVRCHPHKNRDPYKREIEACLPFLEREIELVSPQIILSVGAVATRTLLPGVSLRSSHGQVFEYKGIPTVVLYHPAGVDRAVPKKTLEDDYKSVRAKVKQYWAVKRGESIQRTLVDDYDLYDELEGMLDSLEDGDRFGFDIETNETEWARQVKKSPDPISNSLAGIAFSFHHLGEYQTYYIPTCDHPDVAGLWERMGFESEEGLISRLAGKVEQATLRGAVPVIHNAKFEFQSLRKYGMWTDSLPSKFIDTMIMAHDLGHETVGLKDIVKRVYGVSQTTFEEAVGDPKEMQVRDAELRTIYPYACDDAYYCLRLGEDFERELNKESNWGMARSYELRASLMDWVVDTELAGVGVDLSNRDALDVEFTEMIDSLNESVSEHLEGRDYKSAAAKADALFAPKPKGLGLKPPAKTTGKVIKTKSGKQISTKADDLKLVSYQHPVIGELVQLGSLNTIRNTFIRGADQYINPASGRVHASVNQTGTATGRLSYSFPNLTNVPVRSEEGRKIRRFYTAAMNRFDDESSVGEDWTLWAIDQSQIELRWAAHFSQDQWMIGVLSDLTRSIHEETCQAIYKVDKSDEKLWLPAYKKSKNGNFARLYLAGDEKIAQTLEVSLAEAAEFSAGHKSLMWGFDDWTQVQIKRVEMRGYAETAFGFRRPIPQIRSRAGMIRSDGEKLAVNAPIQGTAAQHIQSCMVVIAERLKRGKYLSKMLWQVHDEVVGVSPASELEEVTAMVKSTLEHHVEISVPTPAEVSIGPSWGEVKEVQ